MKKENVLGNFLYSRRKKIQPSDVGLKRNYGRRRTPGLRREEVAELAGVSTTWYTWLEQGRDVNASREVIESIGKALQLSPDEYVHLLHLANFGLPAERLKYVEEVTSDLQNIIDHIGYPAIIANNRTEILAWNELAKQFIYDFDILSPGDHILTRLMIVDPYFNQNLINWEEYANFAIAYFRSNYDQNIGDHWYETFLNKCFKKAVFLQLGGNYTMSNRKKQKPLFLIIPSMVA